MRSKKSIIKQQKLLKEAIQIIVQERKTNNALKRVKLTEQDLVNLEEGRWDSLKSKLAAAGLAIACTATGCAPVVSSTGAPADASALTDIGISPSDFDDVRDDGESHMDFDDEDHNERVPLEAPPNKLGGSTKRNTAANLRSTKRLNKFR